MSSQESQFARSTPALSPQEAQVLDAMIESMSAKARAEAFGRPPRSAAPFSTGFAVPDDAQAAAHVSALLSLIGQCPAADPPADLVQRTLDRVADVRRQRWFAEQTQALAAPRWSMGWNEIGAIAAILLISASLLWPMLGRVRDDARKLACAGNLQMAGMAMGRYANDYQDQLPRRGTWTGQVWWNVGKQGRDGEPIQSNSAHLYALVRGGYIAPESLNCPENASAPQFMTRTMNDWAAPANVSYSYQNQYSRQPLRLNVIRVAILADKNPLFTGPGGQQGLTYRADVSPETASSFHGGSGQNVLMAHGGAVWLTKPVLTVGGKRDNIWLANGVQSYTGTETPENKDDSFLVP